jgi:hypothetical protein
MYVFYLVNRLVDFESGIGKLARIQRRLRAFADPVPLENRLRA